MQSTKTCLFELSPTQVKQWLKSNRHKPFHEQQIRTWLYQRNAQSFEEMTDLSKDLRASLETHFHLGLPTIEIQHYAHEDDTEKILLRLPDGEGVETVRMPHHTSKIHTDPHTGTVLNSQPKDQQKYTLCLSTQAGCLFACRFCASGQGGLSRNLNAGEILSQVLTFTRKGDDIARIVFMGTGEPLHNLHELKKAIDILCDPNAFALSHRRITVSTVGLVPEIYQIAQAGWKVKLAVSLHATTDEKRAELMPLARGYQIGQLLDALKYYQDRNKRRITFEYLMIDRLNDTHSDAERLAAICKNLTANVNLIPFNSVERTTFRPSSTRQIDRFKSILHKHKIDATVRYSRGRTIDAACGQLRLRNAN